MTASDTEQGTVTGVRYFPDKLSHSRNDPYSTDATACHHCREQFAAGQTRFPILDGVNFGDGWGLVSVCIGCFKSEDYTRSTLPHLQRYERACLGCSEPMLTPIIYRFRWQVCSIRCYQRANRKRRREHLRCAACKKHFKPTREDARFCSGRCRQWTYRQRKRGAA